MGRKVSRKPATEACRKLLPYLVEKREQAKAMLALADTMNGYGDARAIDADDTRLF